MKRKVFLAFTHIKKHIDLSFLDLEKISTEIFIKGWQRPNGNGISTVDTVRLYLKGDIPEDYNSRINAMIDALGGEKIIQELFAQYEAKYSDIVLYFPSRTSEDEEGGTISLETLRKICDLKLGMQIILE